MFFTNHVLAGALIGSVAPGPLAAGVLGVGSHVAMDVVPHWGQPDWVAFLRVARRDGLAGLALGAAALAASARGARVRVLAGVIGAAALDLDKPCQHFFGRSPFPPALDRFHQRIQRGRESPTRWPRELAAGTAAAGVLIVRSRRARQAVGDDISVASRCVELLQAELDCIRWPGVSADFGPGGVS